eukprot:gene3279-3596_t
MEVASIQGVLWKLKRNVTGVTWKRQWVYADDRQFLQWSGKTRPLRGEKPKYALQVSPSLLIEECNLRKFAFQITDLQNGFEMIFAADDNLSFNKWMKILRKKVNKAVSISEHVVEQKRPLSPRFSVISRERDRRGEAKEEEEEEAEEVEEGGAAEQKRNSPLLEHARPEEVIKDFFGKNGSVQVGRLDELLVLVFPEFCVKRLLALLLQDLDLDPNELIVHDQFMSWYDLNASHLSGITCFPSPPNNSALNALLVDEEGDLQDFSPQPLDIGNKRGYCLDSTLLRLPSFDDLFWQLPSEREELQILKSNLDLSDWQHVYLEIVARLVRQIRVNNENSARPGVDLQAYREALSHYLALKGKFLEEAVSTAKKIVDEACLPPQLRTVPLTTCSAEGLAIYEYHGLTYKVWLPTAEEEAADSLDWQKERACLDSSEAFRKLLGRSYRAQRSLSRMGHEIYCSRTLASKYHADQMTVEEMGLFLPTLNTTVDYAGLRIIVFLRLPSSQQVKQEAEEGQWVMREIQSRTGLSPSGLSSSLCIVRHGDESWEITGEDWLPPDLSASTDRLRLELLEHFVQERQEQERLTIPCARSFESSSLIEEGNVASWLELGRNLYNQRLPRLAAALDSHSLPLHDCLSLSQAMHSAGANMRHLGTLYHLVRDSQIKLFLFHSMIARSMKTYLRQLLVSHLAMFVGRTKQYLLRGKSQDSHYIDHQEECKRQRLLITLEAWNLLLHPQFTSKGNSENELSESCRTFLMVLLDLLYRKYGLYIQIRSSSTGILHYLLPNQSEQGGAYSSASSSQSTTAATRQLLQMLQWQCGLQLKEEAYQLILPQISLSSCPTLLLRPLQAQDFYSENSLLKVKGCDIQLPGELGYLNIHLETLQHLGLYDDVAAVLGAHYVFSRHLLGCGANGSGGWSSAIAPSRANLLFHFLYALSRLARCGHATDDNREKCGSLFAHLVKDYLTHVYYSSLVQTASFYTSRILTLCFCQHYENGATTWQQYFDSSLFVNMACLAPNSVLYASPFLALARLYLKSIPSDNKEGAVGTYYKVQLLLESALSVYVQHPSAHARIQSLQLQLALVYIQEDKIHAALDILAPILASGLPPTGRFYSLLCHSLAVCHYRNKDFTQALHCIYLLLQAVKEGLTRRRDRELELSSRCLLFNLYMQQSAYVEALEVATAIFDRVLALPPHYRVQLAGSDKGGYRSLLRYLAFNIVSLVFCTLPATSRALLESAALECLHQVSLQETIHLLATSRDKDFGTLPKMHQQWTDCVRDVAMLVFYPNRTVAYMVMLIDALQPPAIDQNEKEGEEGGGKSYGSDAMELLQLVQRYDLGLQAAILFRCAEQSEGQTISSVLLPPKTPLVI